MEVITCIGQRIQATMEKKEGLKQAHLAKMTNINPRRLQLIIRDEMRPSMTEIQRISRVLSVKVSYLLAGVEESPPSEMAPNPELVELLKILTCSSVSGDSVTWTTKSKPTW